MDDTNVGKDTQMLLLKAVTERPYGRHLFSFLVCVIRSVKRMVIELKDCPSIYLILIDRKELNMLKYYEPCIYSVDLK